MTINADLIITTIKKKALVLQGQDDDNHVKIQYFTANEYAIVESKEKVPVHLINRTPSKLLSGEAPYEITYGQKPSYEHIRAFGTLCFAEHKFLNFI